MKYDGKYASRLRAEPSGVLCAVLPNIDENGKYKTTGADRTGCVFCMFGCHLEKEPNRFQQLAATHPKLYSYCINGGSNESGVWLPDNKGLGLGKVLDYIGVNYKKEEIQNGEILELDKE